MIEPHKDYGRNSEILKYSEGQSQLTCRTCFDKDSRSAYYCRIFTFRGLLFPREIIAVHINPGTHPNCGKKHLEAVEFGYCYPIEKPTKDAEGKKKKKLKAKKN